jgi:His/Glu/Gln/Arg/opine family amino acid ABC transporter permease subunit
MSEKAPRVTVYVAPAEPPPSRRPPITSVGPVGWLRANLFSGWKNSVATVITGGLIAFFLYGFLSWSVRTAQWAVVFNNLRLLTSGQYNRHEIWRMELVTGLLVLLTGLGLGIWGRVARGVFIAVVITLAVVVVVPLIGAQIPEPTIYVLMEPQKVPANFVFVGYKGQEVTFTFEPLTTPEKAEAPHVGNVEQDSRVEWATQVRNVRSGSLDLSQYNLSVTLRLRDGANKLVSNADGASATVFDAAQPGGTLTFTLARDGWYTLEVSRDDADLAANQGYAWLKIDGVSLYSSQEDKVLQREFDYGPQPTGDTMLYAVEEAYRFDGARTLGEFISIQVAPLFNHIALPLFVGAALFCNGWLIGMLGKGERTIRRATLIGWVLAAPAVLIILRGFANSRVLPEVPTNLWGGLLLTILLTIVGITASFPLGVALALGRRSSLPAIKWTCTIFIETIRGVPLITILFMAKLIVPFFWSALSNMDLAIRMMIGLTLFSAAYLAENVRGGLQIIPAGQIEAARALGLNPFFTTTLIVLPQALRAVIPAIVGQFISLFKDTSLVALVGLFELVGIVDTIVSGQPVYRPYQREAYIFIAIVYFVISYAMSDVSRRLETSGAGSVRRA